MDAIAIAIAIAIMAQRVYSGKIHHLSISWSFEIFNWISSTRIQDRQNQKYLNFRLDWFGIFFYSFTKTHTYFSWISIIRLEDFIAIQEPIVAWDWRGTLNGKKLQTERNFKRKESKSDLKRQFSYEILYFGNFFCMLTGWCLRIYLKPCERSTCIYKCRIVCVKYTKKQ